VEVLDLWLGAVVDTTELGTVEVPLVEVSGDATPAPGTFTDSYLNGPQIRLSPSGSRIMVFGSVETYDPRTSTGESSRFGWLADVAPDGAGPRLAGVQPGGTAWQDALAYCGWLGWLSDEELAGTCWDPEPADRFHVRTIDIAGRTRVDVPIEMPLEWGIADPVLDTANRTAWLWEPAGHVLHRVDLDDGSTDMIDPDPEAPAPVPEIPRSAGEAPEWATTLSDYRPWSSPMLVSDPDGSRLYAVGVTLPEPSSLARGYAVGSSGIWVFDASSFALVDHWPAAAAYSSIGLTADGRWLIAAGQPGVDAAGGAAGWSSSVSIHDTRDGRLSIQLGDLGEQPILTFP
jgi:hypothetical protein